jgi:hypothetical protein
MLRVGRESCSQTRMPCEARLTGALYSRKNTPRFSAILRQLELLAVVAPSCLPLVAVCGGIMLRTNDFHAP